MTAPDTVGSVGGYSSIVLDTSGNPVVAYFDGTNGDLKLLHCDDPNCAVPGESITSPDSGDVVGTHTSIALDAAGNPIVAYHDSSNFQLKVLHCDDPNCAVGGDSATTPDPALGVGMHTSMQLDAAGNPVVSYYDETLGDLKVLWCSDPGCTGDNSIASPDTSGIVGSYTSLALDVAGNPVITYQDTSDGDLKVLHCDDRACGVPPSAVDDSYATAQATTLTVAAPGVLGNDTDPDSATLRASAVGSPSNGVATVNSDGSFSYTPASGFVGVDSFAYEVADSSDSDIGAVVVTVSAATALCAGLPVSIDMTTGASGTGTAANDVILGTSGADTISGLGGDDVICGEGGNDTIDGGDGLDFIYGADGNDTLTGGDGNDRIRGGPGIDIISGGLGNDFLYGGIEGDIIDGGEGNDTIGGFGGDDTINAGPGNDLVFGGFGADIINGGPGADDLRGLIGDDTIHGNDGNDTISGDNGRDTIYGDAGNDKLFGGNSLDSINGNDGDDNLNGGKADDSLNGGAGTDVCTGNLGTDTATTCETIFGVP